MFTLLFLLVTWVTISKLYWYDVRTHLKSEQIPWEYGVILSRFCLFWWYHISFNSLSYRVYKKLVEGKNEHLYNEFKSFRMRNRTG